MTWKGGKHEKQMTDDRFMGGRLKKKKKLIERGESGEKDRKRVAAKGKK